MIINVRYYDRLYNNGHQIFLMTVINKNRHNL